MVKLERMATPVYEKASGQLNIVYAPAGTPTDSDLLINEIMLRIFLSMTASNYKGKRTCSTIGHDV